MPALARPWGVSRPVLEGVEPAGAPVDAKKTVSWAEHQRCQRILLTAR
jgi:hypothetical protein